MNMELKELSPDKLDATELRKQANKMRADGEKLLKDAVFIESLANLAENWHSGKVPTKTGASASMVHHRRLRHILENAGVQVVPAGTEKDDEVSVQTGKVNGNVEVARVPLTEAGYEVEDDGTVTYVGK